MKSAKKEVQKMLEQLPNDATFEDIQYHIYAIEKIERGLKDIKGKKTISQADIEKRMAKWLGK